MALRVDEIGSSKIWEEFLLKNSPNALFQSWLWGDVLKSRGEKIWRLGFYEGSTLEGIALVNLVAAKRGTFLHVRHGPILIHKTWKEVLHHVRKIAIRERAWFIRISPLVEALPSGLGLISSPVHEVDGERCWVLDLDTSEDALLANMRKTTRYEIKQAQKLGVEIVVSKDENDLNHFNKLYQTTAIRQGFVAHKGIVEEFKIFARAEKALLYLGKYQGQILATAIILFYGDQAIYHHSASTRTNIPVNYLLQWEAIREAKKRGMKVYNFWGIAPNDKPNHPWRGLTLFKKGFGGREVSYVHSHDLPISPLYVIPRTIESVRRFVKGY